jgi:hypothetical protein
MPCRSSAMLSWNWLRFAKLGGGKGASGKTLESDSAVPKEKRRDFSSRRSELGGMNSGPGNQHPNPPFVTHTRKSINKTSRDRTHGSGPAQVLLRVGSKPRLRCGCPWDSELAFLRIFPVVRPISSWSRSTWAPLAPVRCECSLRLGEGLRRVVEFHKPVSSTVRGVGRHHLAHIRLRYPKLTGN